MVRRLFVTLALVALLAACGTTSTRGSGDTRSERHGRATGDSAGRRHRPDTRRRGRNGDRARARARTNAGAISDHRTTHGRTRAHGRA